MTKVPASKAKGTGKTYSRRTAFRRPNPDRQGSASRKLLKERVRTIINQLNKVEFELFGHVHGEDEEE